jgi:hypothetical protein
MPQQLDNPYLKQPGKKYVWLKGNLHAHSTRSDGVREAQAVLDEYARRGYHFFALTDHDIQSDYGKLDPKGMVLIPGNEVSAGGCHILCLGTQERVPPIPDRQQVINKINAAGGIAILNHPDWLPNFNHCTYEMLEKFTNYSGMEIYNGGVIDVPGSPFAYNKWDRLLGDGRIVWGHASDDSHQPNDDGRGWDVVLVPEDRVNAAGVLESLRNGCFYASSGVTIQSIEVDGCTLHVHAPDAQALEIVGEYGRRIAFAEAEELSYNASELRDHLIRVQCYGRAGRMAWTQPFVLSGGTAEKLRQLSQERRILTVINSPTLELPAGPDDPIWAKVPGGALPYTAPLGEAPAAATKIQALRTPSHLVFRILCEEPEMGKLRATSGDGDPSMWTNDSIELFMDIDAQAHSYLHAMINAGGRLWSGWVEQSGTEPAVSIIAARGAREWSVQAAFRLDSLKRTPLRAGERWGFHACRNRTPHRETSFWTWTGGRNHNPGCFGWLQFA